MDKEKLVEKNRNRSVPLFECDYNLFDHHLEFYTALGFEIIYYQKAPYRFASVIKEGIGEFGFYGNKNFKENGNRGGCYIYVPNIQEVFADLKSNLKSYYGKIPSKGIPRISRINKTAEDWRVNITDPGENTIIIGETFGDSTTLMEAEDERVRELESKFEKAYAAAYRLAYSKEDFLAARNTLEVAFRKFTAGLNSDILFKAKVLQAEVFASLGQKKQAKGAIREANEIQLTEHENVQLNSIYERLKEINEQVETD